jgi:nucleotide-binding universal stress UspA family protein
MKILLAADGSEYTRNAARHLVSHLDWFKESPRIHVLNVRPPFPFPHAAAVVGKKAVADYESEEADKALAVAIEELRKAGVAFESSWRMGEPAKEIAAFAAANGFDLIAMGAHGHGYLAGVALGSVASKVIASTRLPVLIAR